MDCHGHPRQRLAGRLVAGHASDRPGGSSQVIEGGSVEAPVAFSRAGHYSEFRRTDGGPFEAEEDVAVAAPARKLEAPVAAGREHSWAPGQRPGPARVVYCSELVQRSSRKEYLQVLVLGDAYASHCELGPDNRLAVRIEDAAADGHILDQAHGQFFLSSGDLRPAAAVALGDRQNAVTRLIRIDAELEASLLATRGADRAHPFLGGPRGVNPLGVASVELRPGDGLAVRIKHLTADHDDILGLGLYRCIRQFGRSFRRGVLS